MNYSRTECVSLSDGMQTLKKLVGPLIFIFAILVARVPAHADTKTVAVGTPVTIEVSAAGSAPFTYQWKKDGVNIAGATSASYSIAAASTSSAGVYTAVVSNSAGSVVSDQAVLTVNNMVAPTITTQPVARTVPQGASATFSVAATGTTPSYQWRKNGVVISGATSASYAIAATASTDAGSYSVVVSNGAGSITSSAAALTVNAPVVVPAVTTQPVAKTVTAGAAVTFSVVASGTSPSYQWRKNGAAISGATSSSYTIASAVLADAGTYTVVISNSSGSVTSASAALTVNSSSLTLSELTPTSFSARGASNTAVAADKLFDGLSTTAWLDRSASTWVMVNFAEATVLDAYSITSAKDAPSCDPTSWKLSGSNDGVTWTVIETRTGQSWASRQLTRDFVLATTSAPYTKFRFDFTVTASTMTQIAELELYGSSGLPVELTPTTYAARGASNTAVAVDKLFDGLSTTAWLDRSTSTWATVTFAKPTVLDAYSITSAKDAPSCDPTSWKLSGSNDGVTWTVIETRTGQSWASRQLTRDFVLAATSAAYTRFRFDFTVTASTMTQIAEIEFLGNQ